MPGATDRGVAIVPAGIAAGRGVLFRCPRESRGRRPQAADREGTDPMTIPGFTARAGIAVEAVRARFPRAAVHRVEASASAGPTTTPMALDRLRVLFRDADGTVLAAEETGYGEFGPLRRLDRLRLDGPGLDWPVAMELAEADNLKEQAAWIDPYVTVVLRGRAGGGAEYVFAGAPGVAEVVVDAVSGEVRGG